MAFPIHISSHSVGIPHDHPQVLPEEEVVIIHTLENISECESDGKQFYEDGTVVSNKNYNKDGVHWSTDWGKHQINDYYHEEVALSMGYDIMTEEGNTAYAEYLFGIAGTSPWSASQHCWSKLTKV